MNIIGNHKLLHLHHLGLADEHHGQAAGVGSVLGTAPHANPNIERHGPQKAALQRLDRGAHEFREDTVSSEPASGPLHGEV